MRDRLIELYENSLPKNNGVYQKKDIEEAADYLLANGVILPPCKVGDIVYIIDEPVFEEDYVLEVEVRSIEQKKTGLCVNLDLPLGLCGSEYIFPNNLGKTVFLTKEEAEAKLKERENNA